MARAPSTAILGFRPHTYWTAAVAVSGRPRAPKVLERRRIDFAAGKERGVFHQAETMDTATAEAMIAEVRVATEANALRGIGALLADLQRDGVSVRLAVVPSGNPAVPERVEEIVKSHSRMHAAEGNFYRAVVAAACSQLGLEVQRVPERDLPALTRAHLRIDEAALEARLKAMGAALGPPWSIDQKLATEAAWIRL